jgi:hypothetical protein
MHVVWVDVQVKTAETQLEVGIAHGRLVLAQEEVGEKEEYYREKHEKEPCA